MRGATGAGKGSALRKGADVVKFEKHYEEIDWTKKDKQSNHNIGNKQYKTRRHQTCQH